MAADPKDDGASAPISVTRHALSALLNSPLAGMAPWILMAVISGPGRFEAAAATAFVLSVFLIVATHRRGTSVKLLEVFDAVYFGVMAILALFAAPGLLRWLEYWGGEMANLALVLFALGSIIVRVPFTLQYAREQTEEQYWHVPLFIHINYVITWAWVLGFGISAAAGFYGDAVLHDPGNFWTGWIIQIGGTVFAAAFTEFYPDYATYRAAEKAGTAAGMPPKRFFHLFDWIPVFVLAIGISGLVTDSLHTVTGVVLIVLGAIGMGGMNRLANRLDSPA